MELTKWDTALMLTNKTSYKFNISCYGIFIFLMIGCLFYLIAVPQDVLSQSQEPPTEPNQKQIQMFQQDLQNRLDLLQNTLRDQSTVLLTILGFLLIVILILLYIIFIRYRTLANKLDIENLAKFNSSLKQDFLSISNRIQTSATTFDADELYQKLAAENGKNTDKILKLLKPSIDNLQNEISSISQKSTDSSQRHEGELTKEMLSQEVIAFCNYYNAGIKDRQEWTNFLERYNQNYKIDVVNAEERYLNPQKEIAPIFKASSAGCFLALYIEAEMLYAVVPVYDLVVGHSTYFPGAFGEVFNCSQFDDRSNYRISELIKPAIFEPDDSKETWKLKEKGILELQET